MPWHGQESNPGPFSPDPDDQTVTGLNQLYRKSILYQGKDTFISYRKI